MRVAVMIKALSRSVSQLSDPAFRSVLLWGLGLTIIAYIAAVLIYGGWLTGTDFTAAAATL